MAANELAALTRHKHQRVLSQSLKYAAWQGGIVEVLEHNSAAFTSDVCSLIIEDI